MAKDLGDAIGTALGRAAREAANNVATNARKRSKDGSLTTAKGFAAGAGLAALAPLVAKGAGKLGKSAKDTVGKGVQAGVEKTADKAGGAGGIAKKAGKSMIPGLGNADGGGKGGGTKNDMPGVGKGRRMPIQQAVDVAVPVKTAYNQWTQFEDWPQFMHRLENVSQEDESHVHFKTKIWGISKEFTAEIVEQEPDKRIKWKVTDGVTHTGVVTFHELADRLTRIEVNLDIEPGSLIEKAGRGMRHVKRAVRADLARFKAYVTMEDEESGSWRGRIEDGDVKRRSSSSRSRSSASRKSRSSASSSRGRSSSSRKSSSGSRSSSNGSGSSSGGRGRTTAKSRSSSNGRSSGSRSGSSRKKSGSRS
jgi:uncharacterized membrane protein